jgi:hypothetical protein
MLMIFGWGADMSDERVWSVDLIAANNLAKELGLDADDAQLQIFAAHFARHRFDGYEWAAQRTRSAMLARLESALMEGQGVRSDAWYSGFVAAEEVALTVSDEELLGLSDHHVRTQGQVLRAMVRQAKAQASGPTGSSMD